MTPDKKINKLPNLTLDPVYQLFIKIAIPSSIGTIFQTLYSIVDTYFAGTISSEALAAIGQTFPVYFIIIAVGVGLSIGTSALVANHLGSKEEIIASSYFCQSILLALITAIFMTFIGINFSPIIILSINNNLTSLSLSMEYLNIIFSGSVFIFLLMSLNSSLSAQGDTKSYRNILIFSFILNIILNPILISGYILNFQILPAFGIKGIAISTIISQIIGIIYLLFKLSKTVIYKKIKKNFFYPNLILINKLLSQGIPASIGMLMISIGYYFILFFVGKFGDLAIAGYGAAIRYEQLFLLPLLGLNTAMISMVGQNFGAENINRVKEIYIKGILIGCSILFIFSFLMYFTSEWAMNFFTEDQIVIDFGTTYLKIISFMLPIYPFFFISNGFFQGLKKPLIVMYVLLFRLVIMPFIILWVLIIYLNYDYPIIFWSLVIINWFLGILYYFFTRYNFMKKL